MTVLRSQQGTEGQGHGGSLAGVPVVRVGASLVQRTAYEVRKREYVEHARAVQVQQRAVVRARGRA